MSESVCPNCGNELSGDRPKFCDQCGCDLSQLSGRKTARESSKSSEQKQALYLEKLKEAWTDGKVPIGELKELSALQEELGITSSQAEALSKKAIESLRPVQKDDFEEESQRGTSHGIALSINTNQFYMQGFRGVIDIKLENMSDKPFDSVKVELSSDLLARSEHWSCRLGSCQNMRKRFSLKPDDAGIVCVQFRISARQGNSICAYWADTDLPIFEHTQDLRNISIQADKLIDFGSVSDNAKNMGNSVRNHIENLLKFDKIRTANDLMTEYRNRKLQENFRMLRLTFDPERSEQLTNSLTVAKIEPKEKRIVQAGRGSLADSASLRLQAKDTPVNIVLVAKSKVSLGKYRGNDIVTRICPRSKVNDHQSNQISRNHCQLELSEKGALIKDNNSVNGTLVDGKAVDAEGKQIKANSKELELGGVLKMSVRYLGEKRGFNTAVYEDILDEPLGTIWETAAKSSINSITLERVGNLGIGDKNGCESYCLLCRIATIGSKPHCSISFADKGLEPIHAAIMYLGQRFYLENVSDLTDVVVNDTTLSKNELIPLSFGDRIRIARLEMRFSERAQLYLDLPGAF
jgi:pSer/pThr/pTyr-binding forkhead associated (FHA) protein